MSSSVDSPVAVAGKGLLRVVFYSAILFSAFQLVTSAFSPLSSTVVRALHVGFLLLLTFLLHPLQGGQGRTSLLTKAVGFGALLLSGYHWIYEADLVERAGELTQSDMAVGVITLVLVFEAARRVMGPALPLICLGFLAYALFGEYLPGSLAHRGYGLDQVVGQLAFGTEGI